jgi:FtsZ-interacting cell division protein ZipA
MSTGLIVAIVVVAIIIIALLVMLPRMRAKAREKKAERELHSRRQRVAEEQRSEATERERQAEMAEQKARIAQQEAERERAEANLRHERAQMHERGMADHELIDEDERDRFQGVTGSTADRDGDGHTMDDRTREATGRDEQGMRAADMQAEGAPSSDYERGRMDEKRFGRERITDDVRDSERTNR